MLFFYVAFILLLTTIKQWNSPLFSPGAIYPLEDSCLSCPLKYSHSLYSGSVTCTRYDNIFSCLELILGNLKIAVGLKTHHDGCMIQDATVSGHATQYTTGYKTHNATGHKNHNKTGFKTHKHTLICQPISFSSRSYLDITTDYGTNCTLNMIMIASYFCQYNCIIMPLQSLDSFPHNLFKKTETPQLY